MFYVDEELERWNNFKVEIFLSKKLDRVMIQETNNLFRPY